MSGHGGKRRGAGRPSKFQTEQKRAAAKQELSATDERRQRALAAAEEHLYQMAEAGEKWAVQELLDREKGKAAVRQQEVVDTEIVLVQRFPSQPFVCPQCGYKEAAVERSSGEDFRSDGGDALDSEDAEDGD